MQHPELNLFAFDHDYDSEVLLMSFDAIRDKNNAKVVTDDIERSAVLKDLCFAISIHHTATCSFQNLLKNNSGGRSFYIAQCLMDFGYPASAKGLGQTPYRVYHFFIAGIARLRTDLGKTFLRPENRTDKLVCRFFGNDIDFDHAEHFSNKYYLVSTEREKVRQAFDTWFMAAIARYDDVLIAINGKDMYITFGTSIDDYHTRAVEDILSNCNFLA